jgi:S-methylmethionine-dependent homocysteine/selenocysteine methylase
MIMSKYRDQLPHMGSKLFLTDGGLETTLIFHQGIELPCFAAFDLMRTASGKATLRGYYKRYLAIARAQRMGFVLEAPTWRANRDWGVRLGYSREALAAVNRECIELMDELRRSHEDEGTPIVISGNLGPRGDGYDPGQVMAADEAEAYHAEQIGWLADAGVDMISAFTITNTPEAIGIARAARGARLPVVISFTLETDSRLPTGETLRIAIETVDASTQNAPAYYMINCAHPTHFEAMLAEGGDWLKRLRGLRANASRRSHAELDAAFDLDDGDPVELGGEYRALRDRHSHIVVLGGCCGTDHRHLEAICAACLDAH